MNITIEYSKPDIIMHHFVILGVKSFLMAEKTFDLKSSLNNLKKLMENQAEIIKNQVCPLIPIKVQFVNRKFITPYDRNPLLPNRFINMISNNFSISELKEFDLEIKTLIYEYDKTLFNDCWIDDWIVKREKTKLIPG